MRGTDRLDVSAVLESVEEAAQAERPWPVRLLTLLLLVQAAGFSLATWQRVGGFALDALTWAMVWTAVTNILSSALAYIVLGMGALLTALLFWLLWRQAWALAILLQGLTLLVVLVEYGRDPTLATYPLMAFAVFMVIYLHNPDIRTTFAPPSLPDEEEFSP